MITPEKGFDLTVWQGRFAPSTGSSTEMVGDLDIFRTASALARYASRRHELIAENIAQSDTPGYRPVTLEPFDAALAKRRDAIGYEEMSRLYRPIDRPNPITSPDGNGVTLEKEMAASVDAQTQHQAALAIYRKSVELLRLSVTTRS